MSPNPSYLIVNNNNKNNYDDDDDDDDDVLEAEIWVLNIRSDSEVHFCDAMNFQFTFEYLLFFKVKCCQAFLLIKGV
jgi:hypothetical protein